ncbi:MAG: TonB-dependent receptor [Candidatus Pseudobacter hemicellulosilyticus]|uniref:TonB-dependent receptor n=1 Tax=Candidatus Pseudobacter hemicellulosilyticus TaxID=3121375 RepID=A0AAJ5WW88_9BACT|nr:MAG: TonB-dependent receptor [Pseudobacter sp.]
MQLLLMGMGRDERQMQLEGRILTREGQPVPAVSIRFKHLSTGTTTDEEGLFRLACHPGNYTLVFSHTGFQPLETGLTVAWNESGKQSYEVVLEERTVYLKEVLVTGRALSASPSLASLKRHHRLIPGGSSLALMEPAVQRLETLKDALKYEPGVIIQEFFGANDQPRLSIRGSGIQSNPQRRGIYLLQDGIPVNFADGSFIIGVMDPSLAASVEVFKGANAAGYGAATLGGALNFNTRTGRQQQGLSVKSEGGSFGYGSVTALLGDQWDNKDAHLALSASRQDGFRQHNSNNKAGLAANFGYRVSEKVDTRTYLNFSHIDFDVPGPLTLTMIEEDPAQLNKGVVLPYSMGPDIARDKPGREATVLRVSHRMAVQLAAETDLTLAVYYQHVQDRFVFPIVLSTQRSAGHDLGATISLVHTLGKHRLSAGLIGSYGSISRRGHINKDGLDSYMFSKDRLKAANLTVFAEDDWTVNHRWRLIAGLQAVTNTRNSRDVFPDPDLRPWYSHTSGKYRYFHSDRISLDQQYHAVNPRLGAIFQAGRKKELQFFGNISASYEPPTFDELVGTAVTDNINTSPKQLFAVRLDKQTALTTELGSRYEGSRFGWNISLYHSWLRNELLEVKDFVLGVKETRNYPRTIHRGIELGLMAIPIRRIFSASGKDQLMIRGMYTYSDFYFSSGEYTGNKLAGVPPHYISASLEYRNKGQFFVAASLESQPQPAFVDHQNTLVQPAFTIYGCRIGYEGVRHFSFYVEGKNIGNRHYAASYIINDQIHPPPMPFPAFTVNNIAFFMPGPTRAIYVGVSYQLDKRQSNKNSNKQ